MFKWRSTMAEVTSSYLDPTGEYFNGFGYSSGNRYNTPSFWSGQGGALAFQMFRLGKGATDVYVHTVRRHDPPKVSEFPLHGRQYLPDD